MTYEYFDFYRLQVFSKATVVCVQAGLEARQCDQCRAELRAPAVREDGNSAAVRVLEQRLEEVEAAAAQREAEELLGAAWVTWIEIGYSWISSEVAGGHNLSRC